MSAVLTSKRAFFAAEVIQASNMDCGPATLQSIIRGFGGNVALDWLRERCKTDVDGTSIDEMEAVCRQLGFDAQQIMIPLEHLFLNDSAVLPAVAASITPNGWIHFVVIWRVHGHLVQIMNPAVGRRWVTKRQLERQLYSHTMAVPSSAWRAWAGSAECLEMFGGRLARLQLDGALSERLLARGVAASSWHSLAALEAGIRFLESFPSRAHSGRQRSELLELLLGEDGHGANIPSPHWSVRPLEDSDDVESIQLSGIVLIRIKGLQVKGSEHGDAEPFQKAEQAPRSEQKSPGLVPLLAKIFKSDSDKTLGLRLWILFVALMIVAASVIPESLMINAILRISGQVSTVKWPLFLVFVCGSFSLLLLKVVIQKRIHAWSLDLELKARFDIFRRIPELGDAFFRTRPVGDLVERTHRIHQLSSMPSAMRYYVEFILIMLSFLSGCIMLGPQNTPMFLLIVAVMFVLPRFFKQVMSERFLRLRGLTGALSEFYLGGIKGLVALRGHGGQEGIFARHEETLKNWSDTYLSLNYVHLFCSALITTIASGLCLIVLAPYFAYGAMPPILVVVFLKQLPRLGKTCWDFQTRLQYYHSTVRRLAEFFMKPSSPGAQGNPSCSPVKKDEGAAIRYQNVSVASDRGHILQAIDLSIPSGQKIAVVGVSGSGKSSLAGLLLGWLEPTQGQLYLDGIPLRDEVLAGLRKQVVWLDSRVRIWNRSLLYNLLNGSSAGYNGRVLEQAGLIDMLRGLPRGLQTRLGEAGNLLSCGEAQRVRLARGMNRGAARLVIMDEPFRGIDRRQARQLLEESLAYWKRASLIYITHQLDEALLFPRVLVVENGRIIEDGDPRQLMGENHAFGRLLLRNNELEKDTLAMASWRRWQLHEGQLLRRGEPNP